MPMFPPGTLWQQIRSTTARARGSGALLSIPTRTAFIEDGGVRFLVRVVGHLAQRRRPSAVGHPQDGSNPFLPYDPAMYVADASETHVCLLNRFNVVDHHLLIVTRRFVDQQSPLDHADFWAWSRCLAEYESLGFYNAGSAAGASQPHKHLQLVPLPLVAEQPALPLDPYIAAGDQDGACRHPWPPFRHAAERLVDRTGESHEEAAESMLQIYHELLRREGLSFASQQRPAYNLLVTRRWMLLVPRRHEHFESISLNALAFVGALLVHDEEQLQVLKQRGPMSALVHVAGTADRC